MNFIKERRYKILFKNFFFSKFHSKKIKLKIDIILISMLGCDNKSCTISTFPFLTAQCNAFNDSYIPLRK